MNRLLGICALILTFGQPVFMQAQRMSPEDQDRFNSYYSRWLQDRQNNDRDDIAKHAGKMEETMARYNIPPNTFDEIATANGYAPRHNYRDFRGRLSSDDQEKFDKSYQHWIHERSENDLKGMAKEEGHMQEIMARYNIPQDVPYDVIVSGGARY